MPLQKLECMHEQHKQQELERKYAIRYHKVKFFERVKLERRIKKKEKEIAQAKGGAGKGDETERLHEDLKRLKEDLAYVVHFPKAEKYISILGDCGAHPGHARPGRNVQGRCQNASDTAHGPVPLPPVPLPCALVFASSSCLCQLW